MTLKFFITPPNKSIEKWKEFNWIIKIT